MKNLYSRAIAAHSAENESAAERQRAHMESKRLKVIEATQLNALILLGVGIAENDITLIPTREPNHPNVYGETRFWLDGVLFCFFPWARSWSVRAREDSDALGFTTLASLGEALLHEDFAHLRAEASEAGDD